MILHKMNNNFFNSGHIFLEDEYKLQVKYTLSNVVLIVAFTMFFFLACSQLVLESPIYYKINFIASLIVLTTLVSLRVFSKKHFYYIAHCIFIVFFIFLFIVFRLTPETFPMTTWFLVYIMALLFIFPYRVVSIYLFSFISLYFYLVLSNTSFNNIDYISNFIAPSILGYIFIIAYELRTNDVYNRLKDVNLNLEERIKEETKIRTKILEKEKQYLNHIAHHDYLSGLPNIIAIDKTIEALLNTYADTNKKFALLYLDLNGFKKINDNFGHRYGNIVIKVVSQRLLEITRSIDFLSRIGGDEFLIIVSDFKDRHALECMVQRYMQSITKEISLSISNITLSCSIGISIYPDHALLKSDLILYADRAMMKAKKEKDKKYLFYSTDINDLGYDKILLEMDMHQALKEEEFVLHFQPQVDVQNNSIVGVEALVRWNHPQLGLLGPDYFLEISKNANLILRLEYFIMEKSIESIVEWRNNDAFEGRISINISIQKFEDKNFMDEITYLLQKHNCHGEWIELEITETEIMSNMKTSLIRFNALKALGISIALDDFGTGYSSLSYLKELEVDKLKIDKIFMDNLFEKDNYITIIDAILAIAESFKYAVVAEGVENVKQVEYLKSRGCFVIQGFYYYKPMPKEKISVLLQKNNA